MVSEVSLHPEGVWGKWSKIAYTMVARKQRERERERERERVKSQGPGITFKDTLPQ
jgi:hypothetical protein